MEGKKHCSWNPMEDQIHYSQYFPNIPHHFFAVSNLFMYLATHTTTLTSNSGILMMAIVTTTKRVQWTFNEVPLTASTANIVHVNGSSTSTKVSIAKGHCIWLHQTYECIYWKYFFKDLKVCLLTLTRISQLSTHHSGISTPPGVITHSTPQIVNTDLHSAFI